MPVRILVDYRPALRERTGAGEFVHELVRAYTRMPDAANDDLSIFTSSWKDRPAPGLPVELGSRVIDRRVPVRWLNYAWHRLEWPPVEALAGACDVVHAAHPLLIPARRAAQVITIHDLFFLLEPERTRAEIRRDYPALAGDHARRADAVVTPSHHTAGLIQRKLGVEANRIYLCSPGPPAWKTLGREPHVPPDGYVLFVGTLEPRKNVAALIDAYARLVDAGRPVPKLVVAGRPTPDAHELLQTIERPPLAGHVDHRGYVPIDERERLYAGARLFVMPSFDEGFGLPVLEAMSAGIPVVASTGGSLPEVLGDAGPLVDPSDVEGLAAAIDRMVTDGAYARACAERGLRRASEFSWSRAAATARRAYVDAVARRRSRAGPRV
jgi:glycosyltransferase involved in cell wall biosynthesis